jgi:hypothetical protein
MSGSAHAQSKPAPQAPDNINELFAFLHQCAKFPPGSEGSEITLRFSLTHYGALHGKPMITYSKLVGSTEDQKLFVSAVLDSLDKCTPVPVTEHFGKVVGQRMLTITYGVKRERPT